MGLNTMTKKNTQKKPMLPEIKIEITTSYGTKMKPEIKPTIQEAKNRARELLSLGYQISLLHQQFKKGNWQPLKNQKITHVAAPKL